MLLSFKLIMKDYIKRHWKCMKIRTFWKLPKAPESVSLPSGLITCTMTIAKTERNPMEISSPQNPRNTTRNLRGQAMISAKQISIKFFFSLEVWYDVLQQIGWLNYLSTHLFKIVMLYGGDMLNGEGSKKGS